MNPPRPTENPSEERSSTWTPVGSVLYECGEQPDTTCFSGLKVLIDSLHLPDPKVLQVEDAIFQAVAETSARSHGCLLNVRVFRQELIDQLPTALSPAQPTLNSSGVQAWGFFIIANNESDLRTDTGSTSQMIDLYLYPEG